MPRSGQFLKSTVRARAEPRRSTVAWTSRTASGSSGREPLLCSATRSSTPWRSLCSRPAPLSSVPHAAPFFAPQFAAAQTVALREKRRAEARRRIDSAHLKGAPRHVDALHPPLSSQQRSTHTRDEGVCARAAMALNKQVHKERAEAARRAQSQSMRLEVRAQRARRELYYFYRPSRHRRAKTGESAGACARTGGCGGATENGRRRAVCAAGETKHGRPAQNRKPR